MGDTVKLNAVPDAYKQDPLLGRFVYNGAYRDLMYYEFYFYDGHKNDMKVNIDENGYIYVDPNGGSAQFKLHMTTEEYGAEAIDGKSVKLMKTHYNYTVVVDGDTLWCVKENGRYKMSKTGTPVSFDVMKTTTIDGVDWYSMVDSKNGQKVLVDLTSMNIYEDESSASRTSMFSIISNTHQLFRHIGETIEDGIAFSDTAYVEIFKSDEPSRFLYEDSQNLFKSDNGKGGKTFLGIYNNKEYTHNASLFLDTAYVWDDRVMPTYLLAVDAHHYNVGEKIHVNGATADKECIAAKYLVSLADSTDGSYHGMTRLGFVRGIHVGDSLVISGTNDTLTIARGQLNRGTFAFELVDKIENNPDADFYLRNKDGYVGIMNGVPVLVDQKTTAAMFNMYKSGVVPTANEGLDAPGVKIIAGKGCVTVKGAAGKTVMVTSMLGRIVEKTVAASDNIQLVAPAGVVVVSVEGETPKKTIIK